jgi:CubicO group peptidase (beta-lactamase class C family)
MRLLEEALRQPPEIGLTLAVTVRRHDELVASAYGPDTTADTALLSWSTAKSITHALVGILVRQGRLNIHQPAAVAEWADPADPRHAITVDQLLRMSSGLHFVEDYVDDRISDTMKMLFGDGQRDMAGFAAAMALDHRPGTCFNYSSGTTNIICRLIGQIVGGGQAGMEAFLQAELFGPLGMTSATARFDESGTFVGSSYVYATAEDFARFGQLYLDGGRDILPAGWVAYAASPTPTPPEETDGYGAHWWLHGGLLYASGYEGQYIFVVPEKDLVVVRLGKTPTELRPNVIDWIERVIGAC